MPVTRRYFLRRLPRTLVASLVPVLSPRDSSAAGAATPSKPARPWIRPPGALPEQKFLSTCTRCTACQEACPHQSIRRLGPEFGADGGSPAIIPLEKPCYLCTDYPCITACEPRALVLAPGAEPDMGVAVLRRQKCYVAQGQPCDYCVTGCPVGDDAIDFAADGLPTIRPHGCVGCGVCVYLCPADALVIEHDHTAGKVRQTGRV